MILWIIDPATESGVSTANACLKRGIHSATFYKWKATFGGTDVSDAKKLKVLEGEDAKLKEVASRKW